MLEFGQVMLKFEEVMLEFGSVMREFKQVLLTSRPLTHAEAAENKCL